MSIASGLAKAYLRHKTDPTSWTAAVAAVFTATHIPASADLVGWVSTILGAAMSIILAYMDGRAMLPAAAGVQDEPPAAPRLPSDAGRNVQTVDRTPVRPAESAGPTDPPGWNNPPN